MNAKRILRGRDALAYIVRYLNLGQVIKDGNELMLDDALNFFRGLLDEFEKAEAELEEVRSMNKGMIDLLAKREAELDAARPLLEAIEKWDGDPAMSGRVLGEAIAYRSRRT